MAIDYTPKKLDVAARTMHFVHMIFIHADTDPSEFEQFEEFVKFLDKEGIRRKAGYNKNRVGYMETLRFIWELSNERRETEREKYPRKEVK